MLQSESERIMAAEGETWICFQNQEEELGWSSFLTGEEKIEAFLEGWYYVCGVKIWL
jgi:hypothetical protein